MDPVREADTDVIADVEVVVRESSAPPQTHKDRVRASIAWALEEHATALAKLAK
ncbi:MAG TPA: hypothetical protein VGL81_35200 [Polyangiaceae bacterium]